MVIIVCLVLSLILQLLLCLQAVRRHRVSDEPGAWLLFGTCFAMLAVHSVASMVLLHTGSHQPDMIPVLILLAVCVLVNVAIWPTEQRMKDRIMRATAFRHIMQSLQDTYYVVDAEGKIELISDSAVDVVGYRPEELIGTRLSGFYVDPEGREQFLAALQEGNGRVTHYQAALQHRNGRVVIVETNAHFRYGPNGEITGVEGIARNVTERLEGEQLLSQLGRIVEDSSQEVYVFDASTLRFTIVNQGARNNLGYTMKELYQLNPASILARYDERSFRKELVPLVRGEEAIRTIKTLAKRRDGSVYPVEAQIQYIASELRPVFFAIVEDITSKQRVEAELIQTQRLQSVGQLTGGIAHDFNNMLQALQLNLEQIRVADETQAQFRTMALQVVTRASQLTQRLLAFSRRQKLDPKTIDANSALSQFLDMSRRMLGENIQLTLSVYSEELYLHIDEAQFESMLLNLVINARDAMPSGGSIELRVLPKRFSPGEIAATDGLCDAEYVCIQVRDTGCGMSAEVMNSAFEPFYTTKDVGQGTGLGLSMVYGFVKQSGGHIAIDSTPGQGTTVSVCFPRSGTAQTDVDESGGSHDLRGSESILLIEDEELVRNVAEKTLHEMGYEVTSVASGPDALTLARERGRSWDLILSDVVLPDGLTGPETVEQIRKTSPHAKVVFMSGYVAETMHVQSDLLKTSLFLQKPFSRPALAAAVREALDGHGPYRLRSVS
ncbi:MAG: PAS domain S-box protein [Pseudomonadales bacterium]|nr:PAS domain S-box protein [Pseudomonadales bacterium]